MSGEAVAAVAAVYGAVLAAVIRVLWLLHERVARLEGRLNGRRD